MSLMAGKGAWLISNGQAKVGDVPASCLSSGDEIELGIACSLRGMPLLSAIGQL